MKRCLVAIAVCIFPALVFGEEAPHKQGDKSVNFSFNGFALSDYKYGVGGKYWWSDKIAFTGSIDVSRNDDWTTNSAIIVSNPRQQDKNYGVTLGVERHFDSSSKASPYFGSELIYLGASAEGGSYKYRSESYMADILFGVEYAVNSDVSLAAEYSLGYHVSKNKNTTSGIDTNITTKGFNSGSGKLILLLYF